MQYAVVLGVGWFAIGMSLFFVGIDIYEPEKAYVMSRQRKDDLSTVQVVSIIFLGLGSFTLMFSIPTLMLVKA